ncbi:MAG: TraR/DksA family transcriptional regulator [Planctomycetes bacterium]|nr:TraR/DksA family transcriptional regulator [Planctomycetota bacterium]
METKDIAALKRRLLQRRHRVSGELSRTADVARKEAVRSASGELSMVPDHMADVGTDAFEEDLALSLMEKEEKELAEIDDALARLDDGTYGICEGCGKRIPMRRLRVIPHARLCIRCKRAEEEGERSCRSLFCGSSNV